AGLTRADGTPLAVTEPFRAGKLTIDDVRVTGARARVSIGATHVTYAPRRIPGVLSLLPPLLAILVAVFARQALLALFGGVWLGALILHDFHPLTALLVTFDEFLVDS